MRTLTVILTIFVLAGCVDNGNNEVYTLVQTFLTNSKVQSFEKIDTAMLSQDLQNLIQKASDKTRKEEKKVAGTNNKPLCLEGHIFSSLYEGWNTSRIMETEVLFQTATVKVEFKNTAFGDTVTWNDNVLLVYQGKWKVDNVKFNKIGIEGSTKEILGDFINY